jgi:hypothetical protein
MSRSDVSWLNEATVAWPAFSKDHNVTILVGGFDSEIAAGRRAAFAITLATLIRQLSAGSVKRRFPLTLRSGH